MRELLIARLDELVAGLAPEERQRSGWRDFLIELAEMSERPELLRKEAKTPIADLLQSIDERSIAEGIKFLGEEIEGLPVVDLYQALIEVLGEINRDNRARLAELRETLAELATPVIRLWQDVLLVPLIGTLDSQRAQNMAEKVLEKTAAERARVVIVDVTGVPVIDTIVGGFLIEMFNATKLLGAEVILTGIKPEIAHTLVKIGIDFNMVVVKRDLESALVYAVRLTTEERARRSRAQRRRGNIDEE